jgi:uncharacterized protein with von Willebrand factor type A (vWA) domain
MKQSKKPRAIDELKAVFAKCVLSPALLALLCILVEPLQGAGDGREKAAARRRGP